MRASQLLVLFLCVGQIVWSQQGSISISGRIYDNGKPMEGVSILIAETDIGTVSDESGFYRITASRGDILRYSYLGMETVEIIVEDVTSVVNINMEPKFEELDEVVVERRKRSQKALAEQYETNKNLIRTGFGIIDYESLGFSMRVYDGSELSLAGIDFIGALQSLVPGMRVFRPPGDPLNPIVFLARRFNSAQNPRPAAYEVDGVVYTDAPTFIDIPNIERIAVINSPGALTRYGSIAAGGLIVINTKVGTVRTEPGKDQPYDQARLRDNIFREENLDRVEKIPVSREMEKLMQATSLEQAKAHIEENGLLKNRSPYFVMDIGRFMLERWGEEEFYLEVLESLAEEHAENAVVLKAITYTLEELGKQEKLTELYLQIFKLRSSYGQSYRDLANAYASNKDTIKAINLLSRYVRFREGQEIAKFGGIDSIIQTELDHLLSDQSRKRSGTPTDFKLAEAGTRIYFEWNHGDAEFELQFVNPEDHFFKWNHTYQDNYDRFREEKLDGYSSEQFFIDDYLAGKWQVNLKYLGNKSYDPTYLKATIYHNFGTAYERREQFLFVLKQKELNVKLFSLINNPLNVSKP